MANKHSPKHTIIVRDAQNQNGLIVPNLAVFAISGTMSDISGSTTGSISFNLDALAVRLRRVEVFHSGAATLFNARLENATPNTGSSFDPRNVITCYTDVPGGTTYADGLDQIEDMIAVTDNAVDKEGNLYLKFMPHGSGLNSFKYLLFFEAVMLYQHRSPDSYFRR